MSNSKVSVIVPVYKAEKYIERCVRSLMEQTLKEMEFIFVNDCTPDRSMEILQRVVRDYPQRLEQVRVLTNERNSGVSYSRNQGIGQACGEYLIFCDSDDWMEPDMYEALYYQAAEQRAAIVCCDFSEDYPSEHRCIVRKQDYSSDVRKDMQEMLRAVLHGAPWNKLIKRELYLSHQIDYPEKINMWEDLYTSVRLFFFAGSVGYVPRPLYHYMQQNPHSLLNNPSRKAMSDKAEICNLLEDFFRKNGALDEFTPALQQRKLWAKMSLVTDSRVRDFRQWRELWPDAQSQIQASTFSRFNKTVFQLVEYKLDFPALLLLQLKSAVKNLHWKQQQ